MFVFAITQVSHLLLDDLSWRGRRAGAARAPRRLVGVELHDLGDQRARPGLDVVRLLLLALMLASLLMAVAIPEAFGDRALLFAGSYVAIQVGRHPFLTFAGGGRGTIERSRAPS